MSNIIFFNFAILGKSSDFECIDTVTNNLYKMPRAFLQVIHKLRDFYKVLSSNVLCNSVLLYRKTVKALTRNFCFYCVFFTTLLLNIHRRNFHKGFERKICIVFVIVKFFQNSCFFVSYNDTIEQILN